MTATKRLPQPLVDYDGIFQGDHVDLELTFYVEKTGALLDLTTATEIELRIYDGFGASPIITKLLSTDSITVPDQSTNLGKALATFETADTNTKTPGANYTYEVWVTFPTPNEPQLAIVPSPFEILATGKAQAPS